MEIPRLRLSLPYWGNYLTHPVFAGALLATLCLGLHRSALSAGWRYDDGPHLYLVARYSPWQYFFVPEIMREQSWANFTPWNVFFYEIGLPFFGLNPMGHYVHLLFILWLTSVATFFLLRLWLSPLSALMAGALFLTMPATGAVGQMLMTGHYAYGLLFSVFAFYFFARGVRENRIYYSLLTAGLYALACWNKELYVPIIGILFFFPEGDWKVRLRYLWPAISVAFVYTIYRLVVLEGIGGYGGHSLSATLEITNKLAELVYALFGSGLKGKIILTYVCISVFIAVVIQKQKINLLFLLSCFIAIFLPIVPMMSSDFSDALFSRLLFFVSWSLAVMLAWITSPSRTYTMICVVVMAILAFSQHKTVVQVTDKAKVMEEQNRFIVEGNGESLLLPAHFADLNYLDSIRKASIILGRRHPSFFLRDEEELMKLGAEAGSKIYEFNDKCRCILQIGVDQYYGRVENLRTRLAAGENQYLSIFIETSIQGFRRRLSWKFSGSEGNYELHVSEYGVIPLPSSGEMPYASIGSLNQDVHVYVSLISPKGWIARSPLFTINPTEPAHISWQGKSASALLR